MTRVRLATISLLLMGALRCAPGESISGTAGATGSAGAAGSTATVGSAGAAGSAAGDTGGAGASGAAGDTSGPAGAAGSTTPTAGAGGGGSGGGGAGGTTSTAGAGGGGKGGASSAGGAAGGGAGGAAGATNKLLPPVETWMEHWFEHVQLLKRVGYNDDVAVYFDPDVAPAAVDWLLPYMTKVWQYTRATYGEFSNATTDGRLYQIAHTGKYSGGHPSTYFDSSHDFRNVSDCGPGPWTSPGYDIPTHEVSHVVEGANNKMHGSPQFGLWGDSKWAEFFLFDVYTSLGMTADATRVQNAFSNGTDSFPQAGTHWFRDWFYPLWRDHGHAQVMVRYFKLVSMYFPKNGNGTGNGYARNMTMGEFVHFMSGAAQTDLSAQATTAFGATHPTPAELAKAKTDFPQITY